MVRYFQASLDVISMIALRGLSGFSVRTLLSFDDSSSRFPMAAAPSSSEWSAAYAYSDGEVKTDSESAANIVDR